MSSSMTKPTAYFSLYGSLVLIWIVALFTGGIEPAIQDISLFVQGEGISLLDKSMSFREFLPYVLGLVALGLPSAMIAGKISEFALGASTGSHAVANLLNEMKEGKHFLNFFIGVGYEELIARGFFLGLLTMIPFLSGSAGLYVLFVVGNLYWSLMHLSNFESEKDRHWLRALPQLVGGLFFTIAFLRFGLLGCILCHFVYNAVLFSIHRVGKISHIDVGIILAGILYASIGLYKLSHPLTDVLMWLESSPVYILPGWGFWDYIYLSFIVTGVPTAVFGILLYDRPEMPRIEDDGDVNLISLPLIFLVGSVILFLGYYALYGLLGLFIDDAPIRIVIIAILLCFLSEHRSASAVSCTFWIRMPTVFVSICTLYALGFWTALLFVIVITAIQLPMTILLYLDD